MGISIKIKTLEFCLGRKLPDKAIDLVDEASACLRMKLDTRPEEIDKLEIKKKLLEVELCVLQEEDDKASQTCILKVTNLISFLLIWFINLLKKIIFLPFNG